MTGKHRELARAPPDRRVLVRRDLEDAGAQRIGAFARDRIGADDGRGVSGGGSVGAEAGTDASLTICSMPAGVLTTRTRAVSLSTRNV